MRKGKGEKGQVTSEKVEQAASLLFFRNLASCATIKRIELTGFLTNFMKIALRLKNVKFLILNFEFGTQTMLFLLL